MRIGVIGYGSIGSVLAHGFTELGHDVVANDKHQSKVQDSPYTYRPHEWIRANCDLAVFALPTPTTTQGGDVSIVDSALSHYTNTNATLCLKSTMAPGATGRLAEKYDLPLVYCPEFLRDRSTVADFFEIDRLVLAGPAAECDTVATAFDHPKMEIGEVIETDDYLTAEIGKEAHNAFFATKVSFANQIRHLCEQEGAEPRTVMDIVTADRRNTTSHLDPMLGAYGGKCLPKDTRALAIYGMTEGADTSLLNGTMDMNQVAKTRYDDVEIGGDWPNVEPSISD